MRLLALAWELSSSFHRNEDWSTVNLTFSHLLVLPNFLWYIRTMTRYESICYLRNFNVILEKLLIVFVNISRCDATHLNVKHYLLSSLMHPRIAGWNITLTNSVVTYNDVRKHKNMGAGRRQEMRRLIPSFSRCARAVYEPLASIARGAYSCLKDLVFSREDDFLIQINAFSEITWKLITCQPYLCVHTDFFLISLDLFVDQ